MTRPSDVLVDVVTPLGFRVVVVRSSWDAIIDHKHPEMRGREGDVAQTLSTPTEIRHSVSSKQTLLFYLSAENRTWVVAVAKRDGPDGYLVTTYETDTIKSGDLVWQK